MASIPTSRMIRPSIATRSESILSFLVPAECKRIAPAARFSTSPVRRKKDNNSNRGVSAVRRTGPRPRQTLSMKQKDFANQQLPKPVPIEQKPTGTPDHGLWGFFKEKKLLQTPVEESQHGRAWTLGELRGRDWDTLHQLWWVCAKERNRLATEKLERHRLEAGYGDLESKNRDEAVQNTMKAILDTLAERHLAFVEAHELAYHDPNIEMDPENGAVLKEQAYDPYEPEPEASTKQSTPAKQ